MVSEFALKELVNNQQRKLSIVFAKPVLSVGVYVKAGSRNEDLETSGTAHLL